MDSTASCIVHLREEIASLIKNPSVLDRLCPHIISPDDTAYIRRMYRRSSRQATHTMLDFLLNSSAPGKWPAFTHALAEAEYPYLAKLIETNETPKYQHQHQKRIIEIFSPYLERQLNPVSIVPPLYTARVINIEDKDEIMTVYNRIGATAASMILLQLIQGRLDPELWYHQFLKILFECGHDDLANMLEPEFHPDAHLKCPPINVVCNNNDKVYKDISADNLKTNLKRFKPVFADLLRVPKIINLLVPVVLLSEQKNELLSMDRVDPKKAADMLVSHLLETNNLKDVLGALYAADYPYLADLLCNKDVFKQYHSVFKDRIHIFFPYICERVDPNNIIPHLYASGVINHVDREEIIALKDHRSNMTATSHLLECMQCRQSPKMWYTQFLTALEKHGQKDLADLIEPGFCSDPELWTRKIDESLDIASSLSSSGITISDGTNDLILAINEELRELAVHEESVLKSAVDIRLQLEAMLQKKCKGEEKLLMEVQLQQKVIMDQIQRKRTSLLKRYNHSTLEPQEDDIYAEKEKLSAHKIKTNDNKYATLLIMQKSSTSSVFGTIGSNVVLENGENEQTSHSIFPTIITREWNVNYGNIEHAPHVDDENETSSEISQPSSGYLVVRGIERLEVENQLSCDTRKPTKWLCAKRRLRSALASASLSKLFAKRSYDITALKNVPKHS